MRKRFVFRVNGRIHSCEAVSVASDVEILYTGFLKEDLPGQIASLIDAQESLDRKNIKSNKYKEDRLREYGNKGLSLDRFIEMMIEDDTAGMDDFKLKRSAIRKKYPKV